MSCNSFSFIYILKEKLELKGKKGIFLKVENNVTSVSGQWGPRLRNVGSPPIRIYRASYRGLVTNYGAGGLQNGRGESM